MTDYIFDAWCADPRPMLFSDFLLEVNGYLELPSPIAKELELQWEEPTEPSGQLLAAMCRECRRRHTIGDRFAICLSETRHLDEFEKQYGGERGEGIAELVSRIIEDVTDRICYPGVLVVPISPNTFAFLIPAEALGAVCSAILEAFDGRVAYEYEPQDRTKIPLMTLSLGVITNQNRRFVHFSQMMELAKEMLGYAKTQPGSVFVVDRRVDVVQ